MELQIVQTIVAVINTLALLFTGGVVTWYTWETHKSRKQMEKIAQLTQEANTFSTLTTIHDRLEGERSREYRRYLYGDFPSELAEVVGKHLGGTYVGGSGSERRVLLDMVLSTLQRNEKMERDFRDALATSSHGPYPGYTYSDSSALEIVEWILADFDLITVPYSLNIQAAKEAARAYQPILQRTSPHLLTFVAIIRKLSGNSTYKYHYVSLLRKLGIDTMGVA